MDRKKNFDHNGFGQAGTAEDPIKIEIALGEMSLTETLTRFFSVNALAIAEALRVNGELHFINSSSAYTRIIKISKVEDGPISFFNFNPKGGNVTLEAYMGITGSDEEMSLFALDWAFVQGMFNASIYLMSQNYDIGNLGYNYSNWKRSIDGTGTQDNPIRIKRLSSISWEASLVVYLLKNALYIPVLLTEQEGELHLQIIKDEDTKNDIRLAADRLPSEMTANILNPSYQRNTRGVEALRRMAIGFENSRQLIIGADLKINLQVDGQPLDDTNSLPTILTGALATAYYLNKVGRINLFYQV